MLAEYENVCIDIFPFLPYCIVPCLERADWGSSIGDARAWLVTSAWRHLDKVNLLGPDTSWTASFCLRIQTIRSWSPPLTHPASTGSILTWRERSRSAFSRGAQRPLLPSCLGAQVHLHLKCSSDARSPATFDYNNLTVLVCSLLLFWHPFYNLLQSWQNGALRGDRGVVLGDCMVVLVAN